MAKIIGIDLGTTNSCMAIMESGSFKVIPGWDEGIAMMNVGGKATLVIPSKLGYGDRGQGSDIPPFSPLVFDVELVSVGGK